MNRIKKLIGIFSLSIFLILNNLIIVEAGEISIVNEEIVEEISGVEEVEDIENLEDISLINDETLPIEETASTFCLPGRLEIPNIIGQNINDIKNDINFWARIYCIDVSYCYDYNDSYGECIIYDQKFENNKLIVYVSKGCKPLEVPNVVGQNINDVKVTLEKWACDNCIEFCTEYCYNDSYGECIIYDQKFENNKLTIYVSKGCKPLEVPNVVGQNINDVKATLEKWTCDNCVEFCTEYCYNDSYGECIIYNQKFENNKLIVYVSKGCKPLEVPNVVGQNINDVKATLEKWACDNCVEFCTDYEYSEIYEENIIYDQKFENNKLIVYVSDGSAVVDNVVSGEVSNPNFGIVEGNPIVIDGYYNDWNDKPAAYIYNWDNSNQCWYDGVWIEDECYKTEVGTFDTNVRHKAQLFCDGEYIYLHLIFSKDYLALQNGNDYQFYVDGEMAAFQIETPNRETIVNYKYDVGIHNLFISHRNSSMSYEEVIGSKGYITCYNENNYNNELELKIPLSELQRQNPNIDLDDFSTIEWFSPNLGYERITITCTPTIPIIITFIMFSSVLFSYWYFSRKK